MNALTIILLLMFQRTSIKVNCNKMDYETALCTGFNVTQSHNNSHIDLSVHVTDAFWDAVQFYRAKDIQFIPVMIENGNDEVPLDIIHCESKDSTCNAVCSNTSICSSDIYTLYLEVYVQCELPGYDVLCDLCEPAVAKIIRRCDRAVASVYTTTTMLPRPHTHVEFAVFVVVGAVATSVVVSVLAFIIIYKRRRESQQLYQNHLLPRESKTLVIYTGLKNENKKLYQLCNVIRTSTKCDHVIIKQHFQVILLNVHDWVSQTIHGYNRVLIVRSESRSECLNISSDIIHTLLHAVWNSSTSKIGEILLEDIQCEITVNNAYKIWVANLRPFLNTDQMSNAYIARENLITFLSIRL